MDIRGRGGITVSRVGDIRGDRLPFVVYPFLQVDDDIADGCRGVAIVEYGHMTVKHEDAFTGCNLFGSDVPGDSVAAEGADLFECPAGSAGLGEGGTRIDQRDVSARPPPD